MWAEKFKLSKQLTRSITEAGYLSPKAIQAATLSRINGGQDIIAVAPEGAGKTSTYVLGVLNKIKYGFEEAPRALILVPSKEKVESVLEHFSLLNKNKSIRVVGLYAGPSIEAQMDEILDGVDIVVATPDRARAVYLKLALNVNKISTLVIDDAEQIVNQGLQLPVVELANSIGSCQHLVFAEVYHEKIEKMIGPLMKEPAFIEIDELEESGFETIDQIFYQTPNFKTKLNLLYSLIADEEVFTKAVVFVNTRLTAEKVYQHLLSGFRDEVAVLNPLNYETRGFQSYDEFLQEDTRILIISNEIKLEADIQDLPFIFHFELPEEKEIYISRVIKNDSGAEESAFAITFVNAPELAIVKKIEQSIGKKANFAPLPDSVVVAKDLGSVKEKSKQKPADEPRGEAFHDKKSSNNKTYNYGAGVKARMTKKKKH